MACRVGWRCVATCGLRLVVGNFLRLAARVLRVWGVDVLVGGAFFWFLGTQPGGLRDAGSIGKRGTGGAACAVPRPQGRHND